jgi:hypothetical protein
MKKFAISLSLALVFVLVLTMAASATQPDYVEGYVPLNSLGQDESTNEFWYDVCDPYLVGHVVQPLVTDGLAIHGTFTAGNSPFCEIETELSGTCEVLLIPVEIFGDPESKPGRGIVGNCTGDLAGTHGRFLIDEWYGYQAWYHIDP